MTAYEVRISDWSSDVCSSDLGGQLGKDCGLAVDGNGLCCRIENSGFETVQLADEGGDEAGGRFVVNFVRRAELFDIARIHRSEERSVGKEWVSRCRSRWS